MLRVDFLPARHGDCIWLEYGDAARPVRILIDGGPGFAYPVLRARVAALPPRERRIDVLVVTHIDGDHIEGVIRLLRDTELGLQVGEIWFNGAPQMAALSMGPAAGSYGVLQGDYLGKLIRDKAIPWNRPFGGKAAMAGARVELPGGASAIVLSPMPAQLLRLRRNWSRELEQAGIAPDATEEELARLQAIRRLAPPPDFGPAIGLADIAALAARSFEPDTAPANGSSIALLFDYADHRLLLLGDAFSEVVEAGLDRIAGLQDPPRLHVDMVKLPHHGSRANIGPGLLRKLQCDRYVVSSDGTYFRHPDAEALARVLTHSAAGVTFMFNYRSAFTAPWADPALQEQYHYAALYPAPGNAGISLPLIA